MLSLFSTTMSKARACGLASPSGERLHDNAPLGRLCKKCGIISHMVNTLKTSQAVNNSIDTRVLGDGSTFIAESGFDPYHEQSMTVLVGAWPPPTFAMNSYPNKHSMLRLALMSPDHGCCFAKGLNPIQLWNQPRMKPLHEFIWLQEKGNENGTWDSTLAAWCTSANHNSAGSFLASLKSWAADEGSDRSRPPLRSFDDAVRIGNKNLSPKCTLATYPQ